MARQTPTVHNGVLTLPPPAAAIPVGSAAWVTWLAAPANTSFRFRDGAAEYTARREPKPGGWYWYAYRRHGGRLHKRYLGRDADLTPERLAATAALLAAPVPAPASDPPTSLTFPPPGALSL